MKNAALQPAGRAEAKTAKGRAKVQDILDVARRLFIDGGYAEMTMRQVAEQTGISLSNVQHYFPTRENLLQALLESVMESYDLEYRKNERPEIAPRGQLEAAIRYLLADTKKGESEKLFVEIWSLSTRDPIGREIFDRMYSHHRANLARLIAAAKPELAEREVQHRAALIAMQIEGLMLLISENKPRHPELEGVEEACVAASMGIALRDAGT
ncbi:MAG: TetR/AcrR family transcriptional regulator [Betaproteobacteria bacterium]|nr:TetR/AcrR family transcriptional regulator [Betaproteobacteria bacterium]